MKPLTSLLTSGGAASVHQVQAVTGQLSLGFSLINVKQDEAEKEHQRSAKPAQGEYILKQICIRKPQNLGFTNYILHLKMAADSINVKFAGINPNH